MTLDMRVEGGIAAGIFQSVFHTDRISFSTCSTTLPAGQTCDSMIPKLRSFSSFSAAQDENGLSRILVGIHFRNSVERGILQGQQIADWVVSHALKSVSDPVHD